MGDIAVPGRPMTLIWIWQNALFNEDLTMSVLDPRDNAPKPYEHMTSWERSVLTMAMEKILSDIRALEIERG